MSDLESAFTDLTLDDPDEDVDRAADVRNDPVPTHPDDPEAVEANDISPLRAGDD